MTRLARIPFAAALLASSSTVLAAPADQPTASISMTPTGWAVSLGSIVVIAAAIWIFHKVT